MRTASTTYARSAIVRYLKTRSMKRYLAKICIARRAKAIGITSQGTGAPMTMPAASAIAPRSAPTLTTLATSTRATAGYRTQRG